MELFQNDERIALFGLKQHYIEAEESPCLTPEVLRKAVEDDKIPWRSLPDSLRTDVDFSHSISKFSATCLADSMFNEIEELRGDLSLWKKLVNEYANNNMTGLSRLLKRYATTQILLDHNFMAEACLADWSAFELIDDDHVLANNKMFLDSFLSKYPQAMMDVSHKIQLDHPELVHKAIVALGQKRGSSYYYASDDCVGTVAAAIHPSFWDENDDFIWTWLQAGLKFPYASEASTQSVSAWISDRALMLTYALHCPDINFLPGRFDGDVSFVLEVMDRKPEMYRAATGKARQSYRVITVAYAAMPDTAAEEILELHFQGDDEEIQNYLDYLQRKLEPYRTFQSCILGNMLSTQSVDETGTTLTLLNQGLETSKNYKKLLAEFLDVPTGKWLCQLQAAERNVRTAMAPWTTTDRQPESVVEDQFPT